MKLSQYAKQVGISYRTAWDWYRTGKIKGYQVGDTIIITELDDPGKRADEIAVYARVSSPKHQLLLDSQAERLLQYCNARGYEVKHVVKEIGSGVHDNCPQLLKLLCTSSVGIIVIEHKERLMRFGFDYIQALLNQSGRRIEVMGDIGPENDELLDDMADILYRLCARLYGQRRAKRKMERIAAELQTDD